MTGEGALIQALALLREPMGRHALREQALPADIGRLLGLLAGSPLKLDAAAVELGVPADRLLEAVRFYAQQVLLHPAADARRVLGLNPDDDADVAKRHFRALQAWLHPDRAQGAAEAVFASRVNTAWAACRHETGAAMTAGFNATPQAEGETRLPRVPRWQRLESAVGWRSAQTLVPMALLVACALMLWMATRPAPAPTLPEPMAEVASEAPSAAMPGGASESAPENTRETTRQSTRQNPRQAITAAPAADAPAGHAPQPHQPRVPIARGEALTLQMQRPQPGPDAAEPLRLLGQRPVVKPPPVKEAHATPAVAERTADVSHTPVAPAAPSPADPQLPLAQHTQAARQRAQALLAFLLRRKGAPPPIWRNATALESAEATRTVLTGGALFRRPQVQEAGVRWTLGHDEMRVRIPVVPADRHQSPRIVNATLQWHDQQWWVSALTLEATP